MPNPAATEDTEPCILIVDDEPINVKLLEAVLTKAGIGRVVGVISSHEVMDRIETLEPDLVLLDLHMPHPDGFTLLEQIGRQQGPESFLPVVVLTADVTDETRDRALAAGATDFLTKPFSTTETILRVKNHLRTRQLHEVVRRQATSLRSELASLSDLSDEHRDRIRLVTQVADDADHLLTMLFQPIMDLNSQRPIGAEALARFDVLPIRPPNEWFADAADAGVALHLELAAIRLAMAQADRLPEDAFLSVNVSPPTLRSPALTDLLQRGAARPIVVELTEHQQIDEYQPTVDAIHALRALGVRLAVDDAGSGFASLNHILKLQPDFIKLDLMLVTGIDNDPVRRSLAGALVRFSAETGMTIIAEGIETAAELEILRDLGVTIGQGFHLGRPDRLPLQEAVAE